MGVVEGQCLAVAAAVDIEATVEGQCAVAAAVYMEATVEVVAVSTTAMKTIHKIVQSCNYVNGGASCMVNFISSHHLLLA